MRCLGDVAVSYEYCTTKLVRLALVLRVLRIVSSIALTCTPRAHVARAHSVARFPAGYLGHQRRRLVLYSRGVGDMDALIAVSVSHIGGITLGVSTREVSCIRENSAVNSQENSVIY
jgi:hypothetical protein